MCAVVTSIRYIIANTDLPGITDTEKRMVALVARYHRGGRA